jgi:hypothetical protein
MAQFDRRSFVNDSYINNVDVSSAVEVAASDPSDGKNSWLISSMHPFSIWNISRFFNVSRFDIQKGGMPSTTTFEA